MTQKLNIQISIPELDQIMTDYAVKAPKTFMKSYTSYVNDRAIDWLNRELANYIAKFIKEDFIRRFQLYTTKPITDDIRKTLENQTISLVFKKG